MEELLPGARNAVVTCMGVGGGERVVILTDRARVRIGQALERACEEAGAWSLLLQIEDFTTRPASSYPDGLAEEIAAAQPTVSFYAATALEGELAFRRPYMDQVIYQMKVRHGHMVGIDERLILEGMEADYNEIARITAEVTQIVRSATSIEAKTPSGSDMRATFDPTKRRWKPCPGIYHDAGEWGNLPEGETFTSPMRVDGVLAGEVLGDHFSQKYGVLSSPVRLEIENSRIRKVITDDDALRSELEKYFGQHENSDRAGEYAIGTNVALDALSGNLLQDEKIPGVHVAFGYPYPEETGADWTCPSHLDIVATRSTITVNGQPLMRNGEFVY